MNDLVIVFPGQGSQFTGMGKAWFDTHGSVRERFQEASEVVEYSLEDLCFHAPPSELTKTKYAQVSLLVLSYSMYEVLQRERNAPVAYMAGHSLGEITALLAAGVLSFSDAVRLVKVRGEAMEVCATENSTGMIAAIRMPAAEVENCVEAFNADGHDVQVANYNSEEQTVLSGSIDDLKGMRPYLEDRGAKVATLNVAGAFHSTYMANAVPAYVEAIEAVEFNEPTVPVLSTVTGRQYGDSAEIKNALAVQLTSPVRWSSVVSALAAENVGLWIESGPKQVLKKLIGNAVDSDAVYSLDEDTDQAHAAIDRFIEAKKLEPGIVGLCLGAAAATRNRNFNDDEYATGVIQPYRQLQELNQVDDDDLAYEQKLTAMNLLRTIMQTKQVPDDERDERVTSILRRTGNTDLQLVAGEPTP